MQLDTCAITTRSVSCSQAKGGYYPIPTTNVWKHHGSVSFGSTPRPRPAGAMASTDRIRTTGCGAHAHSAWFNMLASPKSMFQIPVALHRNIVTHQVRAESAPSLQQSRHVRTIGEQRLTFAECCSESNGHRTKLCSLFTSGRECVAQRKGGDVHFERTCTAKNLGAALS